MRSNQRIGFVQLIVSLFVVLGTATAHAAIICVPSSFDGSCGSSQPTIQAGISAASLLGGDTVLVDNGLYVEAPIIDRS